jgi:hypothetical protein
VSRYRGLLRTLRWATKRDLFAVLAVGMRRRPGPYFGVYTERADQGRADSPIVEDFLSLVRPKIRQVKYKRCYQVYRRVRSSMIGGDFGSRYSPCRSYQSLRVGPSNPEVQTFGGCDATECDESLTLTQGFGWVLVGLLALQ